MIGRMKAMRAICVSFLATILLPVLSLSPALAENTSTLPRIIISEIKLGGDSYSHGTDQAKDPQEFITLYNQSSDDVDLSGWVLEYAKTTFDKAHCSDSNWLKYSVSSSVSQTALNGTIKPGQVSTPIARSLTDNAGGAIHLVNATDKNSLFTEDLVGWGTNAPCSESSPAATPSNGKSIKRYLDCNSNAPIDTDDNSKDLVSNQPPGPGALNYPFLTNCDEAVSNSTAAGEQACEGVVISELLPNPSGTDTGNEFIELHNPTTSAISLQGCSLQTTANSKVFNLESAVLQPGEYHAFYNSETGLTLSNAAGGAVWLLSPSTELQSINYQGNLADDVSWALVSGSWQATYQPTPNAPNISLATKPCPAGEQRSTETGYCQGSSTVSASTLTPCKEGQERNQATNRCRNIVTASASSSKSKSAKSSSSLTPCKPRQERNPATNRCKSVVTTASATLKPCSAGQERNPATNRCRKVSAASAASKLSSVKDNISGSIASSPHWWLAGFAVVGATGYGVYEWRQEVLQFLSRLKSKLLIKQFK
jgi:hypothetical protein